MIDTKALRSRILDLAIQGKLTQQLESDGTAEILYNSNDAAFDEEIPYSIPNNWKWVKLSNIGTTNIGLTYHPSDVTDKGTIVIRSSNIVNGKMNYSDIVKVNCPIKDNQYVNINDIVICARNGSKALVGKNAIFDGESGKVAFGAFMAIFRTEYYAYVHLYFNTQTFRRYFSSDDSKQINQVTQAILKKSILPLPPLAEQKRIVQRVEEIFRILDTIDEAQEKYSADAASLRSKLITAGIQGKLTQQLPSDGTAEELYQQIQEEKQKLIKDGKIKKEKPLPPIKPEEISFEIPSSWKWVRLCEIFTLQAGKFISASQISSEADSEHQYKCFGGNGIRGYVSDYNTTGTHALIGRQGALCGNVNLAHDIFYATEHAVVVYQYCDVDVNWIFYGLTELNLNQYATSVAQPGLAVGKIEKVLIPLPPLAEQKRIAEKLGELLGALE